MPKYTLSPLAKDDISKVQKYTNKQWGREQTRKYTQQLRDRMRWLSDKPLGVARNDVKEGYRSYPEGKHSIYYRVVNDGIEVIGIPHQSEDIERHFEKTVIPTASEKQEAEREQCQLAAVEAGAKAHTEAKARRAEKLKESEKEGGQELER